MPDENINNRYNSLVSKMSSLERQVAELQILMTSLKATQLRLHKATEDFKSKKIPYSEFEKAQQQFNIESGILVQKRNTFQSDLSRWKSDFDILSKEDELCQRYNYGELESKYNTVKTKYDTMKP
jgi:hypothetical protein